MKTKSFIQGGVLKSHEDQQHQSFSEIQEGVNLNTFVMAKRSNTILLLPEDLLFYEILPRLPARSLGCCMCVCKQWRSFLTTPVFTKMHVNIINNQKSGHHKQLVVVSATAPIPYFSTMDCETPEVGLSAKRPLPFEVGNNNHMTIISSLNGLVCVGIYMMEFFLGYDYLDIILWNPLTGDYKTMMTKNDDDISSIRGYGFYYSSCDDDYKLLRVTQSSNAYIYSWKSDTWHKAKSSRVVVDSLRRWTPGCLVNEKLYFLAKRSLLHLHDMSSLIIRFDTKTETFTEIATPPGVCFSMAVVGGGIHMSMFPKTDSNRVELWKMSMDHDGEWTKVIRSCMSLYRYHPLHLMKNGNWLMSNIHSVNVFKVDDDRKEEEDEENFKKACEHTIDSTMNVHPRGKFVETIVSLN